jgi:hypothetical protein
MTCTVNWPSVEAGSSGKGCGAGWAAGGMVSGSDSMTSGSGSGMVSGSADSGSGSVASGSGSAAGFSTGVTSISVRRGSVGAGAGSGGCFISAGFSSGLMISARGCSFAGGGVLSGWDSGSGSVAGEGGAFRFGFLGRACGLRGRIGRGDVYAGLFFRDGSLLGRWIRSGRR